jgi:Rod binding domain-containing protein
MELFINIILKQMRHATIIPGQLKYSQTALQNNVNDDNLIVGS